MCVSCATILYSNHRVKTLINQIAEADIFLCQDGSESQNSSQKNNTFRENSVEREKNEERESLKSGVRLAMC